MIESFILFMKKVLSLKFKDVIDEGLIYIQFRG